METIRIPRAHVSACMVLCTENAKGGMERPGPDPQLQGSGSVSQSLSFMALELGLAGSREAGGCIWSHVEAVPCSWEWGPPVGVRGMNTEDAVLLTHGGLGCVGSICLPVCGLESLFPLQSEASRKNSYVLPG